MTLLTKSGAKSPPITGTLVTRAGYSKLSARDPSRLDKALTRQRWVPTATDGEQIQQLVQMVQRDSTSQHGRHRPHPPSFGEGRQVEPQQCFVIRLRCLFDAVLGGLQGLATLA